MKLQKCYKSEAYVLSTFSRPSVKLLIGMWHILKFNNSHQVLIQLRRVAPIVADKTPRLYQYHLRQYTALLRRDIRAIRVAHERRAGTTLNSKKLAAKYRVKSFEFENK